METVSLTETTAIPRPRRALHRNDLIRRSGIPADVRLVIQSEDLRRPPGRRAGVKTVVIVAAWASLTAIGLAADEPWLWLPIWTLQAALATGAYSAMHEATHRTLFRSARANRTVALLWASVLLTNADLYRAFHLHHHAFTRQENPGQSEERIFGSVPGYVVRGIVLSGFLGFYVPMQLQSLAALADVYPFYVSSAHARRAVRRGAAIQLAVVGVAVITGALLPATVIACWLLPVGIFYFCTFGFVSMPEHYGLPAGSSAFGTTRTMRAGRLLRFVYWNNNLHVEHHLAPAVPYHALPRLSEALMAHPVRVTGYWQFHVERVRSIRSGDPRRGLDGPATAERDPSPLDQPLNS